MATVLSIIQDALSELGFPTPSSIVGSTGDTEIQMKAIFNATGKELIEEYRWPELAKEHGVTLVSAQEAYYFPTDIQRQVFETMWNSTRKWALWGPLTEQEWMYRKYGIGAVTPRQRYNVRGWTDNAQFLISPTPDSGDAGQIIYMTYQSKTWLKPGSLVLWATGQTISSTNLYRYYGNTLYKSASTGTTGATAPTHTYGTASDGTVNWTVAVYDSIVADTDVPLIDADDLKRGIQWRFLRAKALPYSEIRNDAEDHLRHSLVAVRGARSLNLVPRRRFPFMGPWSVPDGGYGS